MIESGSGPDSETRLRNQFQKGTIVGHNRIVGRVRADEAGQVGERCFYHLSGRRISEFLGRSSRP